MEIVKSSENYSIKEHLENGWKISGSANVHDSIIDINASVLSSSENSSENSVDTISLGYFSWTKNSSISSNYYIENPKNEEALMAIFKKIVEEVLNTIN